jgi:hypothetical protein
MISAASHGPARSAATQENTPYRQSMNSAKRPAAGAHCTKLLSRFHQAAFVRRIDLRFFRGFRSFFRGFWSIDAMHLRAQREQSSANEADGDEPRRKRSAHPSARTSIETNNYAIVTIGILVASHAFRIVSPSNSNTRKATMR